MTVPPELRSLYGREIRNQCDFIIRASREIEASFETWDHDVLWYGVQNLLVAAANISKLLWLPGGVVRSPELLDALQIGSESPFRSREARNHFEHFDERIDAWSRLDPRLVYIDRNVMSANSIKTADSVSYLRNFDPDTWEITFQSERYPLRPLIDEAARVKVRAEEIWKIMRIPFRLELDLHARRPLSEPNSEGGAVMDDSADLSREQWYWKRGDEAPITIRDGQDEAVAVVSTAPRKSERSVEWTAALIAAAPDLLRYCGHAMEDHRRGEPLRARDVNDLGDLLRQLESLAARQQR